MRQNIHIFGASGSGTTTIAQRVCRQLGYEHFDTDSYFWMSTEDPYTVERPVAQRQQLMKQDLERCSGWILSGSLCGWGDLFIPTFDLVVFVYVPQQIRLERLQKREVERYGDKILVGGKRYDNSKAFLDWAAAYETGTQTGRNLAMHEQWLKLIACPILRVTNDSTLEKSVDCVLQAVLA